MSGEVDGVGGDEDTRPSAARTLINSELDDLEQRLERERSDYQRHLLWLLLGASPGALLPMLFVVSEFGGAALVAVILTVMVLEGWRAYDAKRTIGRLERLRMALRERLAEADQPSLPRSEIDRSAPPTSEIDRSAAPTSEADDPAPAEGPGGAR